MVPAFVFCWIPQDPLEDVRVLRFCPTSCHIALLDLLDLLVALRVLHTWYILR